jgi:hypothetical protein
MEEKLEIKKHLHIGRSFNGQRHRPGKASAAKT